jgi:hypothetical protein
MQRSLAQLQQSSRTQQDPVHTFPHPTVVRHLPKVGGRDERDGLMREMNNFQNIFDKLAYIYY